MEKPTRTPQQLFEMLGIKNYTERHENLVREFLEDILSDMTITDLLTQLGTWDEKDLAIAHQWMNLPV